MLAIISEELPMPVTWRSPPPVFCANRFRALTNSNHFSPAHGQSQIARFPL
jgi:hypothetical protein